MPVVLPAQGLREPVTPVRAAPRDGPSPGEIGEVFPRGAVYRGVLAANKAFGIAQKVFAEEE